MLVTCILGSPHVDGKSAKVARTFAAAVSKGGFKVNTYFLNQMKIKGCQGCYLCKTQFDHCPLNDDLKPVLQEVREHTDVLVLATPVYMGEVTAQLKCFVDRMYGFLGPNYRTESDSKQNRLPPGKKLVFIQAQAAPDSTRFADIFPRYEMVMEFQGIKERYLIRGCGIDDCDQKFNKMLDDATVLGTRLAQTS